MNEAKRDIFFPGLDGLRALAAFAVLWTHVERYKQYNNQPTLTSPGFNTFLGGLAVSFFFVLSGFLIGYLLMEENRQNGSVNIRHFLWKRWLRIGPLYYLTLAAGYLVSCYLLHDQPTDIFANGFLLNFFLLPNFAFAFSLIPEVLIQIWSIGTEVQFYLAWPWLISRAGPNTILRRLLFIIFFWAACRAGLFLWGESKSLAGIILFRTRIDCMAIGSLFALGMTGSIGWLKKLCGFLTGPRGSWTLAAAAVLLLLLSARFNSGFYPAYALLFGGIIIRQVNKPSRILGGGFLARMGRISYGIYLLHHFCVFLVFRLFSSSHWLGAPALWTEPLYFLLSGILTIALARISYEYFEKKFLALKNQY